MDEYIEELLSNEVVFEVTLPVLPKRSILEVNENLKPRISILEADLSFISDEDENARRKSNKELNSENNSSSNLGSDEDYANINLDNFEKKGKDLVDSESESDSYDKERKNRKENNHKYLNKKRNKEEDEKYLKRERGKEDKREIGEPEIKVDENSVEYWLNLRKKLGIK